MSPPVLLLVEDDPDLRAALCDVLADQGYPVTAVANGQEALDVIAGGVTPAMIVLDLMMPVMDGHAFLRHRAVHPFLGAVPVVVLTAQAESAHGLHPQVVDILGKPVRLERLFSVIREVTGRPRAAAG